MLIFTLLSLISGVTAYRRDISDNLNKIDWDEIVDTAREIDKSNEQDAYVVWETDGQSIFELNKAEPGAASIDLFREDLLKCGPKGKICMGFYKFAYPMFPGSGTMKGKSVVIKAKDGEALKEALGSNIAVMKINTPTAMMIWKPLTNKLSSGQVSVASALEEDGRDNIAACDAKYFWNAIKRHSSRIGDGEEQAFLEHAAERNQAATQRSEEVVDVRKDGDGEDLQGTAPGPSINMDEIKKLIQDEMKGIKEDIMKKVDGIVDKKVKQVAQEEVGQALRVLGTKTSDAMRDVGKTWIDKSRR